jgi:hypothetical protein
MLMIEDEFPLIQEEILDVYYLKLTVFNFFSTEWIIDAFNLPTTNVNWVIIIKLEHCINMLSANVATCVH